MHVHPVDGNLLLTGSNDWTARLTDLRRLTSSASLAFVADSGVHVRMLVAVRHSVAAL